MAQVGCTINTSLPRTFSVILKQFHRQKIELDAAPKGMQVALRLFGRIVDADPPKRQDWVMKHPWRLAILGI